MVVLGDDPVDVLDATTLEVVVCTVVVAADNDADRVVIGKTLVEVLLDGVAVVVGTFEGFSETELVVD